MNLMRLAVPFLIFLAPLSHGATYDPEERLAEMQIELPQASTPVANYVEAVRTGNLMFLSGNGPRGKDGKLTVGKVGSELTLEQAQQAARQTAINLLATLKAEIGNLNKVRRIVRVTGYVNAVEGYKDQSKVMNGASDLLVDVFGDHGRHTRTAVGVASLPFNIPVEIDMIVEVEP